MNMSIKQWVKQRLGLFLMFVAALHLIKYRHTPTVVIYTKSCKAFSEAKTNLAPTFNGFQRRSSSNFTNVFQNQLAQRQAVLTENNLVTGDLKITLPESPAIKPIPSVQFLASELHKKLMVAEPEVNVVNLTTACKDLHINYKNPPCQTGENECFQETLPEELEDRIRQLAFRPNLQVPTKYIDVIQKMAADIPGFYDIVIVSALSSNHYEESQAMLKNLHKKVFPVLTNFTFVMYNLGLNETEREEMRRYCRCTLLDFPFERFPEHASTLKCFTWKVAVIRAMYEKANFVIWTDASIRITRPTVLLKYIERARHRGIQQRYMVENYRNPYHTLIQTFHHFGDSPCAHMAFYQGETGYGIYHREPLVQHAILDPWLGCAVRSECICPVDQLTVQKCPRVPGRRIGLCMRNEQSAISIILAKLFRENYRYFMVNVNPFQKALRDNTYPYFKELRELEKSRQH